MVRNGTADPGFARYSLSDRETRSVAAALVDLSEIQLVLDELAMEEVGLRAQELPRDLRRLVGRFRTGLDRPNGLVIAGLPIGADRIGVTPSNWVEAAERRGVAEVHAAGVALLLVGSLLGEIFAFGTQHGDNVIIDVFPIAGHETEQLGSASMVELAWHNEDAFHPYRADYLLLLCLRNPQRVATTFASVDALGISEPDRRILRQRRFRIRPDESHTRRFSNAVADRGAATDPVYVDALAAMERLVVDPEPVAVLSGSTDAPFIRIDPHFMVTGEDDEADASLRHLIRAIDAALVDIVLDTGEMLLIDNRRAVHGRRPFTAVHDGTDRWLQRVNVSADLRRSADASSRNRLRVLL